MQDKILRCRDCGQEYVFTAGEQEFFAERGFSEPVRCSSCRAARKNSRSDNGFGERSYGGHSAAREMFPATCARCGKDTQVPFRPRGDRPVYCSDCYSAERAGAGRERRSGAGRGRRDDRW